MDHLYKFYDKHRKVIENILFPALLVLYPFLGIRQGLDVSDATYSLSNFQYFASMDGTWTVATFLANVAGFLLIHLPFGSTLAGIRCYTALFPAAAAVIAYGALKKRMPAPLVFAGEGIALGLCWCPTTILYNYLTYLLMTAGILLLYEGILRENGSRTDAGGGLSSENGLRGQGAYRYYIMAGICLGANVAVRMPNVVQAAFIAAVWYAAAIGGARDRGRRVVRGTLWCMLGYAVGFGIPFGVICARYGISAYPSMVRTMFAMTEKATDYKPTSMLTGMFGDYLTGMFWLLFAGLCMAGGWLLLTVQRRFLAGVRFAAVLCRIVYAAVLLVLLRFYWGRGVFTFQYYDYRSMYYPAVLFLLAAILLAVLCLCKRGVRDECRIAAVLVLVEILVTPLGSNNDLYPIINNLFVAAPFVLWIGYLQSRGELSVPEERYGSKLPLRIQGYCRHSRQYPRRGKREKAAAPRRTANAAVWQIPFVLLAVFVLVQSIGFHLGFAFQDGIRGEKRDTVVTVPEKAAGMYTTQDNAAWLSELALYVEEAGFTGRQAVFYGEVPGLGYLLDMPSALSTFWPDLDSYLLSEYERDMARLEDTPVVIVSAPVAAWLNEDADGMNWFGVDQEKLAADKKLRILRQYLTEHGYQETFGNGKYVVYSV